MNESYTSFILLDMADICNKTFTALEVVIWPSTELFNPPSLPANRQCDVLLFLVFIYVLFLTLSFRLVISECTMF